MTAESACLVLRLAGPLQSWGLRSQFNRRETTAAPTKGGVVGLLAAAQGRRRSDPIEDLLALTLAVRTDRNGTRLRDYHTVSDHRGRSLLSVSVDAKGRQKPTSPKKFTHVTQRFYLQDAEFVAVIGGPITVVAGLADAVAAPTFPLALGRRCCPPTQPLLIAPAESHAAHPMVWPGTAAGVVAAVPWRPGTRSDRSTPPTGLPPTLELEVLSDAAAAPPEVGAVRELVTDLPISFDPTRRSFTTREVARWWVSVPTGATTIAAARRHEPFVFLE